MLFATFVLTEYKHGDHVTLQCPTNSLISIEYAEYKKRGFNGCYDTNAKQNVADECDGKQQCQFTVGSAFFGSDCRWFNAKLKLRYTCIAGKLNNIKSNLPMGSHLLCSHLYEKVTLFLSCHRKFHMNLRHLSQKTTFSLSQRWPLTTGLTVYWYCSDSL